MLSGNPLKVSSCRRPFRGGPDLLRVLGLWEVGRFPYRAGLRLGRLSRVNRGCRNGHERITGRRARLCRDRVRLVLDGSVFGVMDRIAQPDVMLGRLQESLGGHTIIRKPRFFCKLEITLDELLRRAFDLAPCARALKDTVGGIALLLGRTRFATPSMLMWSHEPIQ